MDERVHIRKVVYEKRNLNQHKVYKNLKKKKKAFFHKFVKINQMSIMFKCV